MNKETLHIYTRVSTQTQQDEGTSLESQRELGVKKAKELGFDHKVWNEGGASSHYENLQNRPVLLQLLSEMEEGHIEHLWVYNNDRLSRNEITAQTIRLALQKHGVTLYTQNGTYDLNNPQDKLIKTIFDGLAQYDNALRAERTRLGKLSRVKNGFWMGGPPPFGYQIKDKKLILHDEESKWVKKMYEWYNNGKSTEWIKSELDKAGVQTRRKKRLWSLGSIQKILQNTHSSGHFIYMDSVSEEIIKCECPAIVSKTLWESCQKKRKSILARRGQNNRTKRFYLLRNLLYCGHCRSPMSGRIKESKNERLYYCPRKERQWVKSAPKPKDKWRRGQGCDMIRSLNITMTDLMVEKEVLNVIMQPDRIQKRLKAREERAQNASNEDDEIQIRKLENKRSKLSKEVRGLIENIADVETAKITGQQDQRVANRILEKLNSVLKEKEVEQEQCMAQIQELKNKQDAKNAAIELRAVSMNTQHLSVDIKGEQRANLIKTVIKKIDVFYDKKKSEHELVLHFKIPLTDGNNEKTLRLKKNKKAA